MIENISLSVHLLNFFTLFLPMLLLGLILHKSSERLQKRILHIELALLFWILFQSTLSLNRWYMDQKSGAIHLLFPFVFPVLVFFFLYVTPRGKRLFQGINKKTLILLHATRLPLGILLLLLMNERQTPMDLTIMGLNWDICFGVFALLLFKIHKQHESNRALFYLFHIGGMLSMIIQMALCFFSVAGPHQILGITQPYYAATHFPFSLVPTVLFGLFFVAHLIALAPKPKA